ncbi:BNR repeat-like domain-containing protein [Xylariaceae sp. FL0255]|nr:BNR repeat-like domain-containing protein [Xylariaceae sp. FL0255]
MSFPVQSDPRQPEVHASTLLLLGDKLFCAWFGGTKEGHDDTKIWLSTKDLAQLNANWSEPYAVAAEEGLAHWNPVFLELPGSKIMLFYKVGSPISSWFTKCITSQDGGLAWSKSRDLVPGDKGGRGPVKNKLIVLEDGTILAPASLETPDGKWDCFTDRSVDGGMTWQRTEYAPIDRASWPGEGAIQPSLINCGSGRVSMLTRSSAGHVARSDSSDDGKTWGKMYLTPLFNNNSGLDALRLDNGSWLVVHNPVQQRWGPRTPLVISKSSDEGQIWEAIVTLEDKPPPAGFERIVSLDTGIVNDGESEFSYPAIISDGKGGVHVSYTYERKGIKHVHIDATRLS